MPTKKPARFNARRAERQLDKLWAEAVKARDGYKSRKSGITDRLQAAHIFSRSAKSTRHELDNGVTLTAGEHLFWAHKNPVEFTEWVRGQLGEEKFTLLRVRASKPTSPLDPLKYELTKQLLTAAIARGRGK